MGTKSHLYFFIICAGIVVVDAKSPKKFIFTPWLADKATLKNANVTLGVDYPYPIIDYSSSRKKALDAFKKISN